jgi:hypothetical protein
MRGTWNFANDARRHLYGVAQSSLSLRRTLRGHTQVIGARRAPPELFMQAILLLEFPLSMSEISSLAVSLPRRSFATPIGWLLTIALLLLVIAGILIVAGINPGWISRTTAVLGGIVLLAITGVVTVILAVFHKLRRFTSNDDWVYW